MGRMVGIDLGTTNSVVAVMDGPQPRVLENREGRAQTRSAVGVRRRRRKGGEQSEEILVGQTAVDNWPMAPTETIVSIKRLMGRGVGDREVEEVKRWALYEVTAPEEGTEESTRVHFAGRGWSPIEISALILEKLKEDAEFRLGEEITHAVVTVPAYFSQIQRDATRRACLGAGMKILKILEEPTAAAIAFGLDVGDGSPKTALVFDLGGGTFDISVLMWAGQVFAPLNLEGDMWLGGDNFDEVLIEHAVDFVRDEYGVDPVSNSRFMAELRKAAQAAKERLSSSESADILITGLLQSPEGDLIDVELEVERDEFERMILPLVGRFVRCPCGQVNHLHEQACAACGQSLAGLSPTNGRAIELVHKALDHPNVALSPDEVDFVIMAGNSTTIPLVQRTMEELFGSERLLRRVHPKHSVALGAAMVAALRGGKCVCAAPDPNDPSRECGNVNDAEDETCSACGASLVAVPLAPSEPGAPQPEAGGPTATVSAVDLGALSALSIGGISPFCYGTQSRGDQFNVFIDKGEPFPTAEPRVQVFHTSVPKQRMVSIPIFGGEVRERASANQKQGEAFAVLPPDLPERTPVHIKLWLDSEGVFALKANLGDGTPLTPWVVKGEGDAGAIREIENLEAMHPRIREQANADMEREFEQARAEAFDKLSREQFDEARQVASEAQSRLAAMEGGAASPQVRATGLHRLLLRIQNDYEWGFDDRQLDQLRSLVKRLGQALSGDTTEALTSLCLEVEAFVDRLPQVVDLLLRIEGAIATQVGQAAPARAAELMEEHREVRRAFLSQSPDAVERLTRLVETLKSALAESTGGGLRCSNGHELPAGRRQCPVCGEDTWGLTARGSR